VVCHKKCIDAALEAVANCRFWYNTKQHIFMGSLRLTRYLHYYTIIIVFWKCGKIPC